MFEGRPAYWFENSQHLQVLESHHKELMHELELKQSSEIRLKNSFWQDTDLDEETMLEFQLLSIEAEINARLIMNQILSEHLPSERSYERFKVLSCKTLQLEKLILRYPSNGWKAPLLRAGLRGRSQDERLQFRKDYEQFKQFLKRSKETVELLRSLIVQLADYSFHGVSENSKVWDRLFVRDLFSDLWFVPFGEKDRLRKLGQVFYSQAEKF